MVWDLMHRIVCLRTVTSGLTLGNFRLESFELKVSFGSLCLGSPDLPLSIELSPDIFRLASFVWEASLDRVRLGSLAWELSFGILRLLSVAWGRSLGNSRLWSFGLKRSFGSLRLGSFALLLSLVSYRFISSAWQLSKELRLIMFVWDLSLGHFRLSILLGNCRLRSFA